MSDELSFDDLAPVKVPVSIGGEKYVLHEATVEQAVTYRNACLRAARYGPDGKYAGTEGLAGVEPLLVSLLLHKVTEKGEEPVAESTVRRWPARYLKPLFDRAVKISGLDEKESTPSKNGRPATTEPSA